MGQIARLDHHVVAGGAPCQRALPTRLSGPGETGALVISVAGGRALDTPPRWRPTLE